MSDCERKSFNREADTTLILKQLKDEKMERMNIYYFNKFGSKVKVVGKLLLKRAKNRKMLDFYMGEIGTCYKLRGERKKVVMYENGYLIAWIYKS